MWRFVVMWVLVLALPAQALAGARLTHSLLHGGPAPLVASAKAAPAAEATGDVARSSHCSPASDTPADDTASSPAPAGSCSACAACCLGAALPAATVALPAQPPAAAPAFVAAPAVRSFIASGLERPPRPAAA